MTQFVLHSALDVGKQNAILCVSLLTFAVEEAQWSKALTYLGEVDSYKQLKVHCFVSAGCILLASFSILSFLLSVFSFTPQDVKFMLLHTGKSDDAIKALFMDVHELYLKVSPCLI